jgi:uncharacterized damage-inducible protein DinB
MKELLQSYASYNFWAHQSITDVILNMDENLHQQIVKSSFPNLYATVLHIWDAESIWWQRMKGLEHLVVPSQQFNPAMKEAVNGLLHQSSLWKDWANQSSEDELRKELDYKNLKGLSYRSTTWQVVQHVFNHGTYHRGQLVTMMRELGETEIPATDFIVWCRKQ